MDFNNKTTDSSDDFAEEVCVAFCVGRSTTVMVPARTECPAGWTAEYAGYLMSESHGSTHGDRKRSTYLCWDEAPEIAADGEANHDQSIVYPVEVQCGTLPCSKYTSGRELPCTVCSI